ncbi:GNAT family N-acetyltransferase [Salana multivorans]
MRRETERGLPAQQETTPPTAVLRPLRSNDVEDVLAAFRSNPDMARQGTVTTSAEATAYVDRLTDPAGAHRPWAINVDGRLVGLVCVSVDAENRNGWFWYWLADRARGRGWMKRASATVAEWALTTGGLDRLELGHRVNNPASGAVARAAGFVKEGTERQKFLVDGERIDVDTYSRLRTDPAPVVEPLEMLRGG